jgi:hypothetical protein
MAQTIACILGPTENSRVWYAVLSVEQRLLSLVDLDHKANWDCMRNGHWRDRSRAMGQRTMILDPVGDLRQLRDERSEWLLTVLTGVLILLIFVFAPLQAVGITAFHLFAIGLLLAIIGSMDCAALHQASTDRPSWPSRRIANNDESQIASVISSVSGEMHDVRTLQTRQINRSK